MNPTSSQVIAGWRECDVDADGVKIHVHRTGRVDRPSLLLAHGLSDSGRCWWRVAQALEDDYDIVMIDARNHGQSDTGGPGGAAPTADVAAVVDQLGLDRPRLMGHSVGAQTLADYVAENPGLSERLVLVDPAWKAQNERERVMSVERREAVRSWLASCAEATTAELTTRAREQHAHWPPEEYPTWIESSQQVRPEAADVVTGGGWGTSVAALDCATLLVYGDADLGGIVTDEVARRVTASNPAVAARRIVGAGHNIHREQFDRFIEIVRDFLVVEGP